MTGTNVSRRGAEMPESAMRKLAPLSDAAKARGVRVIHLNIGQPDIETPPEFWEAVRDYPERTLAYAPSPGIPECVEALVEYYARFDIAIEPQQLVVTTGGSEALLFALLVGCDAGGEVIVPEPFYSNYDGLARMAGLKVVPLTTRAENGYRLPGKGEIEQLLTERTGAILYSSPGNPTGVVYTPDEVAMLGEIARENGLFLLADEVYREFTYDNQVSSSALHLPDREEHVIVLDSVSKRYSACGARIGCLVSRNARVIEAVLKLAMTRLSSPGIEQIGVAACVRRTPESYFDEVKAEYTRRRDIVFERLNSIEG
ncbi:MAG: aminotransferase class I/II-fold pyridoxal phosphate-dependent enzyme, partial [Anaerolineales bacterium]